MTRVFVACSCEGTMPLNGEALAKGCPGRVELAQSFCQAEAQRAATLIGSGDSLVIGCTQEAPRFQQMAEELGSEDTMYGVAEGRTIYRRSSTIQD